MNIFVKTQCYFEGHDGIYLERVRVCEWCDKKQRL